MFSNSITDTTYKSKVLPWALKWHQLMQTFSWENQKNNLYTSVNNISISGNGSQMIFFHLDWIPRTILRTYDRNKLHDTIKFTHDISDTELTFFRCYPIQRQQILKPKHTRHTDTYKTHQQTTLRTCKLISPHFYTSSYQQRRNTDTYAQTQMKAISKNDPQPYTQIKTEDISKNKF